MLSFMRDGFFKIFLEVSYKNLNTLHKIKLTHREIDVIACIMSGKAATKKVSSFLSIEPKTVEAHLNNIRLKLVCHSRDSIVDFVEKSGKASEARKHYLFLRIHSVFEHELQQISLLVAQKDVSCLIVYEKSYEPFIDYLRKYFQYFGIEGVFRRREINKPFQETYQGLTPQSITHAIFVFSPLQIRQLLIQENLKDASLHKALQDPKAITLVSFDEGIEVSQKEYDLDSIAHIRFEISERCYFSFFDLLKRIFPKVDLDKPLLEFKEQYDNLTNDFPTKSSLIPVPPGPDLGKKEPLPNPLFIDFLKKRAGHLFITLVICVIFFYVARENKLDKIIPFYKTQESKTIRSDLLLPYDTVLLKRSKIIKDIEAKLKGPQEIQAIALVGIGGAGKTTLARQYARQEEASVVWEINAETKTSLRNSFENLAYALCQTEEERKVLRSLQEIKNHPEKEEKILLFVKQRLKDQEYWILIFDNVEKFPDIQKYFPSDPDVWGRGRIILTTKDEHIKNNSQINHTLIIEELTHQEKLELFTKITNHATSHPLPPSQQAKENFLSNIPPFPLDVSIAARYLETTGISYEKYLEYMNKNPDEFESIQENILTEGCTYPKTRYNIITLSVKKLIEIHKDFKDLLLLISLIDSQNIPRELLNLCKSDIVVDNFIYHLRKYSLVTNESSSNDNIPTFSIHRSTQKISLNYLTKVLNLKEGCPLIQSITQVLENYLEDIVEKKDIPKMKSLISHSKVFLSHAHLLTETTKNSIKGELGFIYFYLTRSLKFAKFLEELFEDTNKLSNKDYKRMARILLYLGNAHRHLGNYQKAQYCLEQNLAICKKHLPENSIERARVLSLLGYVYECSGSSQKAKNLLEKSLMIYETSLPKSYIGLSRTLRYLGTVYRELGYYEKAKNLFEKSLDISKNHLLDNLVEISMALTMLGNVMRDLGHYEEGKNLVEEALKICRSYYPKDHLEIAWVLLNLGDSYKDSGHYEKAKGFLEESLTIYKKRFQENHIRFGELEVSLGNVYKNLGTYEKARTLLKKSLVTYEKYYGKDHLQTIRVLKYLGEMYLSEGQLEVAENLLKKALGMFLQTNHPEAYSCLERLADIYIKKLPTKEQGSLVLKEQAVNYLNQALSIIKEHFPEECPHLTRLQEKIKALQ